MIPLRIDEKKILAVSTIMMPPDDMIMDLIKKHPEANEDDYAKVRSLIQLQILNRDDFSIRESAILAPDELLKFMWLCKAVGKQQGKIASLVDKEFDGYKRQFTGEVPK